MRTSSPPAPMTWKAPGISRKVKLARVKKDKPKYDPDFHPKPWFVTLIAKGYVDNLYDVTCQFSDLTLRQIVEFLVGCTADEAGEWLRVLILYRPFFMRFLIQEYAAKIAREKKRVSASMKKNIPIAVMPNGILRSTPKPGIVLFPGMKPGTVAIPGIPVSSLQS